MNKNEYIAQLSYVSIKSRKMLPEQSGIYYVVDEEFIIWYVGKAKNLRNRWRGNSHHRIFQLQRQRKKQFLIYYELVDESLLDLIEKQRIGEYSPQLNGTIVKNKIFRPTETLLRETLTVIAPYSFLIGIEDPRQEDQKFVEACLSTGEEWRVKKSVISLQVIHIGINFKWFPSSDIKIIIRFLKSIFKHRHNFSNNWINQGNKKIENDGGLFFNRRLLVNGVAIEIHRIDSEVVEQIKEYKLVKLAGVDIRCLDEISIDLLKSYCSMSRASIFISSSENQYNYQLVFKQAIKRLNAYSKDIVQIQKC
ncbi:excinuclease ABC C subunit domain protein [Richelia sinica FACHB-800]|uniref:Excinuclease ABC C subunit domain protein n=2 Tax=Richelia TaxID=98443 RepID=A0A975T9S5_9NOST|nr:GIY-YIG nuclease family protein [Richelia sinica]QXE24724.1 excinuclease ABC C subunit domain protein [Richelia sinica FACHB-800]